MAVVTGSIKTQTNFAQALTGLPGGAQSISASQNFGFAPTVSGVLADQVDTKHTRTYALAASTPVTLDLTNLADIQNNPITFARVRSVSIVVRSQVDGQVLLLGGAGTNAWVAICSSTTATITVYPSTAGNQGYFAWTCPNTTGAPVTSTSKLLKLDPGTNAFSVDVEITGCSA